uniref:Small RNA 2'-O-methyltransferase n=1 Tax=Ornithodoros turicata TaxID=34597 RepID=A0A2R5LI35_9ACAR
MDVDLEERNVVKFDPPVSTQRYKATYDILAKAPDVTSVVDFGCASGHFLKFLKRLEQVTDIALVDTSYGCLDEAWRLARPLVWECLNRRARNLSIKLYCGSVAHKDTRLRHFDAVTCIELIEHLQQEDLLLLPETIFDHVSPKIAVITTPNKDFNVVFPNMQGMRHWDHKFEWTREEFQQWCSKIVQRYPDYTVDYSGVGDAPSSEFEGVGHCSQIAIFVRRNSATTNNNNRDPAVADNLIYDLVTECIHPGRD